MNEMEKTKIYSIDFESLDLNGKRIFNIREDLKYLQNVSIVKINDKLDLIKEDTNDIRNEIRNDRRNITNHIWLIYCLMAINILLTVLVLFK